MAYRKTDSLVNFPHTDGRPPEGERLFTSPAVEHTITAVSDSIADPDIRRMFAQCLPDSLDTTVYFSENGNGKDTFIVTGDIPAMWLRDSVNQIWPYLRFIHADPGLKDLIEGLISRHVACLLSDQYANAFERNYVPWERKYELDSLTSFLRLSAGYFGRTRDTTPFSGEWKEAVSRIIALMRREQQTLNKDHLDTLFHFTTKSGHLHPAIRLHGYGYPGRSCGLVRSVFRPSDDETVFPYLIPANAMAVVFLRKTAPILEAIEARDTARDALTLADDIDLGLQQWGIVRHPKFGEIYAYEVDGFGSSCIMDDPNIPSLLALPYLGYTTTGDLIYRNTRKLILGEWNSFYAAGKFACGVTSPHVGVCDKFWPMATIMQAMTSDDPREIRECLHILKTTHAHTWFIHESVHVDNPHAFTRHWFSWANSLFGEMILDLMDRAPGTLSEPF